MQPGAVKAGERAVKQGQFFASWAWQKSKPLSQNGTFRLMGPQPNHPEATCNTRHCDGATFRVLKHVARR